MSAYLRSTPSLRAVQGFSASAVKQPVRRLHITGAKDSPSQWLRPIEQSRKTKKTASDREFNTSRALKRPNDNSTIDFAFLPDAASLQAGTVSTMAVNVPILPHSYRATPSSSAGAPVPTAPVETAFMPIVQTVAMPLPGQISVMSEVEGATSEGKEMDVFKMVRHVGNVGRSVSQNIREEASVISEVWSGMIGDFVGPRPA